MKYNILIGLLLTSYTITAQIVSPKAIPSDTNKVIKEGYVNKNSTTQSTTTTQTDFTPTAIPPSPNAASLGKYGDIPVSYYTGLVNTSIPIYAISDQDIQIPISLSYHHGGIRVEEEASVVGLGWSLNAGGVITRTIRGRDDFHEQYGAAFNPAVSLYLPNPLNNPTFTDKTTAYANPQLDTEPDMFYYNIGGKSGKFILDAQLRTTWPTEGINGILLEKSDIKIRCVSRTGGQRTAYRYVWEIIDENGINYTFSEQEINGNMYASNISPISTESNANFDAVFDYNFEKSHNITAWYITSIFSPQTNTTVTFDYYRTGKYFSVSRASVFETYSTSAEVSSGNTSDPNCTTAQTLSLVDLSPSTSVSVNIMRNSYLKAINFSTGKVEFQMNDRDDIQKWQTPAVSNLPFTGFITEAMVNDGLMVENDVVENPMKLTNIDIKDLSGALIKRFGLEQSYFNSSKVGTITTNPTRAFNMTRYNNLRLRLDAVKEYNKTLLNNLPPYRFTYEGDVLDNLGNVAAPVELPSKTSWAKDYWGYNNGKTGNNSATRIIPQLYYPKMAASKNLGTFNFNLVGFGSTFDLGIDRTVDEVSKKKGILKSIIYPTGGTSTFDYESNIALSGADEVTSHLYTSTQPTNNSFTITSNDIFADIILKLECTTSQYEENVTSPQGCTNPLNSSTSNVNEWFGKFLKDGSPIYESTYLNWVNGKTTSIIVITDNAPPLHRILQNKYVYEAKFTGVKLSPGQYEILSQQISGFPTVTATVRTYNYNSGSNFTKKSTGGLRIAKIENKTEDVVTKTQTFEYKLPDGSTSGVQMRNPMLFLYGYPEILQIWETAGNTVSYPCQNLWWGIKIQANSLTPLGTSAGGNHVGYSQVTVRDIDLSNQDNGRTIYEYINIADTPPVSRVFPEIATAWNGSNGMLLKETILNKTGLKVKEVINDTPITNPLFSNIYKGFKYFIGNQLLPPPYDQIHNPVVTKSEYSIPSDFWYSPKSKQRIYDINDPTNTRFVETETETIFGSTSHLQATSQKTFDSKNRLVETTMKYPKDMVDLNRDDTQGTYGEMVSANIISPVIEQIQKVGGTQIGLTLKEYLKWSNAFFAPKVIKTQKSISDELVTKITFNSYTSDGKPLSYTELNGITTIMEWWDATNINKKNLVKSKTIGSGPFTQTTTYDYFPLIGIKETVQPNGIKMTYKYDDFNRLENIRDTNGKLIKSNTYNYKGQ